MTDVYINYRENSPELGSVKRNKKRTSNLFGKIVKPLLILGVILVVIDYAPSVWWTLRPKAVNISDLIINTVRNPNKSKLDEATPQAESEKQTYQPQFNPKLTSENTLVISSIKIETKLNEASLDAYEDALRIGVWRVPNFGDPFNRDLPTILAAHRYGYLKWSIPYRLKNSFWSLPKLKVGDSIEIIWKQRRYLYEVYREGKGTEIEDYSADLILYTCESLGNETRIFKYARLLEI